jgi:hypothetical protein
MARLKRNAEYRLLAADHPWLTGTAEVFIQFIVAKSEIKTPKSK